MKKLSWSCQGSQPSSDQNAGLSCRTSSPVKFTHYLLEDLANNTGYFLPLAIVEQVFGHSDEKVADTHGVLAFTKHLYPLSAELHGNPTEGCKCLAPLSWDKEA